eukprot:3336169-Rhodomonas_salina.4
MLLPGYGVGSPLEEANLRVGSAIGLRNCYAMSGTDLVKSGTRWNLPTHLLCDARYYRAQ